ncbi:MAG: NTP transferase domain-containing protein, partial [Pseudomonadota bacterium]
MIVTLIPAAGASTRMRGKDKLLEPVQGNTPALRHAVEVALSAALGPVLVTLRPEDRARRVALQRAPVEVLDVPDAAEGMSASFRVGAARALEI